jgi:uncharacterized membrane protein
VIPTWFLYLAGFSLVILGGLQIQQRPRKEGEAGFYARFVNLGTLWSLICIATGVALLAIALGYWQGPSHAPPPPKPPRYH